MNEFAEGDEVQYSELGLKKVAKRQGQRQGVVVRTTSNGSIWVRWDGIKTAYALHPDYLKPVKEEAPMSNFNWSERHNERRAAEDQVKRARLDDKSLMIMEPGLLVKWQPGWRKISLDGSFTSADLRLMADHMDVVNAQ